MIYKKILKRILKIVSSIILILIIFSLIVFSIEKQQYSYLKIKNNKSLTINNYLIKNVNVIPMTRDTILKNKSIIILDGIIKEIGDDLSYSGSNIIDAQGRYISPGLIDTHMHLWDKFELGLYLANGVTTVRNMLGMPFHLEVKNEINTDEIIGPIFYTASPQFTGSHDNSIEKKKIKSEVHAKKLVKKYKNDGYDYIKTYNMLPEAIFNAVLEEAEVSKIPVVSHPSFEVGYDYHFSPIISTIEHTEDIVQQPLNFKLDNTLLPSIVKGYVESNQNHCPTLTVFYNITEIYNNKEDVLDTEQSNYMNPLTVITENGLNFNCYY